jgi:Amidohydrolase
VIIEGGIGWMASVLRFMGYWWTDHHRWMEPKLDEPPSFYFKRHFWGTFEDDRAGLLTRELIGVDRLMWGSDYPHTEGKFPHSREQIVKDFVGIPENEFPEDRGRKRRSARRCGLRFLCNGRCGVAK